MNFLFPPGYKLPPGVGMDEALDMPVWRTAVSGEQFFESLKGTNPTPAPSADPDYQNVYAAVCQRPSVEQYGGSVVRFGLCCSETLKSSWD